MGKVQFNCRLPQRIIDIINAERRRIAKAEGRETVSQAEVVERATRALIDLRLTTKPKSARRRSGK